MSYLNYTPIHHEPVFTSHSNLRGFETLTIEEYDAWRDSLPESPVRPLLRVLVRYAYALMEQRIRFGNRLFAHYRIRLGLHPSDKEAAEKEAAKVLDRLRLDYERITDGLATEMPRATYKWPKEGLITEAAEFDAAKIYFDQLKAEKLSFTRLKSSLKENILQREFFDHIPGCGPKLSGLILAEFNPLRAPNASSFWRFAGLDVSSDGRGRSRLRELHESRWMKVMGGDGYTMKKVALRTYDAQRKSRILHVGMYAIMQQGLKWTSVDQEVFLSYPAHLRRSEAMIGGKKSAVTQVSMTECPYCQAFLGMRHRLRNSQAMCREGSKELKWCEASDLHIFYAARRYMCKIFMRDVWLAWRILLGYPITEPYSVAKLGMREHHETSPHIERIVKKVMSERGDGPAAPVKPERVYTGDVEIEGGELSEDIVNC